MRFMYPENQDEHEGLNEGAREKEKQRRMQELTEMTERGSGPEGRTLRRGAINKEENHPIMCERVSRVHTRTQLAHDLSMIL